MRKTYVLPSSQKNKNNQPGFLFTGLFMLRPVFTLTFSGTIWYHLALSTMEFSWQHTGIDCFLKYADYHTDKLHCVHKTNINYTILSPTNQFHRLQALKSRVTSEVAPHWEIQKCHPNSSRAIQSYTLHSATTTFLPGTPQMSLTASLLANTEHLHSLPFLHIFFLPALQ